MEEINACYLQQHEKTTVNNKEEISEEPGARTTSTRGKTRRRLLDETCSSYVQTGSK